MQYRTLGKTYIKVSPHCLGAMMAPWAIPTTMIQSGSLTKLANVVLDDDMLDRIDQIVPPGTDVGVLEAAYNPPAITQASMRRRPSTERAVA